MTKVGNLNFTETKTIITYDLSPCEITAQDICDQDKRFYTTISGEESGTFNLPNTTLRTTMDKNTAVDAFKNAVYKASKDEKITRLFAAEVYGKNGYIENN